MNDRATSLLSNERLRNLAAVDEAADPFDKKVLDTVLGADGRLAQIPTLRRGFIDHGLMKRERGGSAYWRVAAS